LPAGVSSILVVNILTLSEIKGIFEIPLTVALFGLFLYGHLNSGVSLLQ